MTWLDDHLAGLPLNPRHADFPPFRHTRGALGPTLSQDALRIQPAGPDRADEGRDNLQPEPPKSADD